MKPEFECSGQDCQQACQQKPGWFRPGEAEAVAELLGMSLEELFASKLGVDWWVGGGGDEGDLAETTFLLSPAITSMQPGEEFPSNPSGQCIFLQDSRCQIHAAKPFECAQLTHDGHADRLEIAREWLGPQGQEQIRQLLGREPEAASFTLFDMLWSFTR